MKNNSVTTAVALAVQTMGASSVPLLSPRGIPPPKNAASPNSCPEFSGTGSGISTTPAERFRRCVERDELCELLGRRFVAESDMRLYIEAKDTGFFDGKVAFLVVEEMLRYPLTQALRPRSLAEFIERFPEYSALAAKLLADEILECLKMAEQELEAAKPWQNEVPEVWRVLLMLPEVSWQKYLDLAYSRGNPELEQISEKARNLMWVAALSFACFGEPGKSCDVLVCQKARIAVLSRCVCAADQEALFADLRRAFKIESDDIFGLTLAEAKALRTHIIDEIDKCRKAVRRPGITSLDGLYLVLEGVDGMVSTMTAQYVKTGEFRTVSEERLS